MYVKIIEKLENQIQNFVSHQLFKYNITIKYQFLSANNNITRDLPKANIQSMKFLIISYPSLLLFYLAHSINFFFRRTQTES